MVVVELFHRLTEIWRDLLETWGYESVGWSLGRAGTAQTCNKKETWLGLDLIATQYKPDLIDLIALRQDKFEWDILHELSIFSELDLCCSVHLRRPEPDACGTCGRYFPHDIWPLVLYSPIFRPSPPILPASSSSALWWPPLSSPLKSPPSL